MAVVAFVAVVAVVFHKKISKYYQGGRYAMRVNKAVGFATDGCLCCVPCEKGMYNKR